MKRVLLAISLAVVLPVASLMAAAGKGMSDLLPPGRRQVTVEMAEQLTRPAAPAPLPANLSQPFSPAEFADDVRGGTPSPAAPGTPAPSVPGVPAAPAAPGGAAPGPRAVARSGAQAGISDREILEMLAPRIPSRGTLVFGGRRMLLVDKSRFEVGTQFTVGYNGANYDLELISIDSTSFTLRYRGEEITRPILLKSGPK